MCVELDFMYILGKIFNVQILFETFLSESDLLVSLISVIYNHNKKRQNKETFVYYFLSEINKTKEQ